MTQIICWARTPSDSRGTAGGTLSYELHGKRSAASVAKRIDGGGSTAVAELIGDGILVPSPHNRPEFKPATGHGVVVVYDNGKRRTFREYA